ncbi:MAG: hypothetical protein AAB116_18295 [Candidatus Poribacteria bacterium]
MAHKRVLMPSKFAIGETLTSNMVAIGMRFAAASSTFEPNIEDTIIAASIEGVKREDYRVLSLLVDWLELHMERVNVDRLTKMVQLVDDILVRAFWTAIAQWQARDWRLKRMQKIYRKQRINLAEGFDFQMRKYGEDERFAKTVLRVPAKLLRHRLNDILSPAELAPKHLAYRYRVMIGPSYRADMWALMEYNPELTPSELARKCYGSFPTAWAVRRDWIICTRRKLTKVL